MAAVEARGRGTLLYMYYQLGFEEFNMGQATAVAIVMIILTVFLSTIQFTASKNGFTN